VLLSSRLGRWLAWALFFALFAPVFGLPLLVVGAASVAGQWNDVLPTHLTLHHLVDAGLGDLDATDLDEIAVRGRVRQRGRDRQRRRGWRVLGTPRLRGDGGIRRRDDGRGRGRHGLVDGHRALQWCGRRARARCHRYDEPARDSERDEEADDDPTAHPSQRSSQSHGHGIGRSGVNL
jgi:hypothetical protein